jgi:hypothetical protein
MRAALLLLTIGLVDAPAAAQGRDWSRMQAEDAGGPTLAPRRGLDEDAGAGSCSDGQVQPMLLRAVREYVSGCGNAAAAETFGRVFGTERAAAAAGVREAAVEAADKIRDGRIRARCSRDATASASWGAVVSAGDVTGDVEVRAVDVETAVLGDSGPGGRSGMLLFKQEQLADGLVHETAHILYSIIRDERGGRPVWQPEALTATFARGAAFWDGTDLCLPDDARARAACARRLNEFGVSSHGNYAGANRANEEAARQIAQAIYMCGHAGSVVGRVLGLRAR